MNVLVNVTLTLGSASAEGMDSLAGRQTDSNGPSQGAGLSAGKTASCPEATAGFQTNLP